MIRKNIENNQKVLTLFPVQGKEIKINYSGERISSDGGLLLLKGVDNQINLISKISGCIKDNRDYRYIEHSVEEMVSQRVYQIAAGYEDCNDSQYLRSDTVIKLCSGRLPQSGSDLASQPTLSRLENAVSKTDLFRIGKLLADTFIGSYAIAPQVIILDCDDTNNNTYGQQELSIFNNYYDEYCYMPLHIYEGLSGKLITTILKPGRRSKQNDIGKILIKLVKYLRNHWPKTTIVIRGDGHFTSNSFMDWTINQPYTDFITGLTGNVKLHELAGVTIKSAEREYQQTGKAVKRYHSFMYKAESWEYQQRVIVKVEFNEMGKNIRYIVTSLKDYRTRDLYEKGYCARGAMELRIKDHKLYLKSDRSSCESFQANQFRMFLHSMAYILMHTLQKELFKGTEYVNSTMKTIQNKIIKTAAWVRELKTKIKIELPMSCVSKNEQIKAFEMLMLLQT
jgi:hypothetical protein